MPIKQHTDVYYQIWDKASPWIIWRKLWKTGNFAKTLSIKKSWPPTESCKKMTIMNLKRPWNMQLKNENIWYKNLLAPWVMMNSRMKIMEVNEPKPMEEQIEPWAIIGNEDHMASNMNDLSPPHIFCPLWRENGPISPQNGQYPPPPQKKKGGQKTRGIANLFSIFICKFWTFCWHLPISQKWGIAKDDKIMHNLWTKFTFVYLDFVNKAVIMEQYGNELGSVAVWCLRSKIQTCHLRRVVRWCDYLKNGLLHVLDRRSSILSLSWLRGVVGHELDDGGSSILSLS